MASLARHYSTLVEILIVQTVGGGEVVKFLRQYPRLEKLVVIDYATLAEAHVRCRGEIVY